MILPVTYQGRLSVGGNAANGPYQLRFGLYDAASGGSELAAITNVVSATNGLFTTVLNLDQSLFPDGFENERWLEIGVRTNGGEAFTFLNARQQVTDSTYAIRASVATLAENVSPSSIAGANIQNGTITAGKIGSGQVVKSLNALHDDVTLAAGANTTITPSGGTLTLSGPTDWHLGGNAGTTAATDFIGTTDSQPLDFRVGSQRALRLQPNGNGAANVIGGAPVNYVSSGVNGATIGGGGSLGSFFFWTSNTVAGDFGTVSGGTANTAGSPGATVSGGSGNRAQDTFATVGGGNANTASGVNSTVGGGNQNSATNTYATIAGGDYNVAATWGAVGGGHNNIASGNNATIGGGQQNRASGENATVGGGLGNSASGTNATVIGGQLNAASGNQATAAGGYSSIAGGDYSFAAGYRAQASHTGAFVWADSQAQTFASTSTNEFSVRSQNGVRIQSDKGIHLNAADEPLIVRDWDVFAGNAGTAKAGIGRWGLFMEANHLTAGVPAISGKNFQVAKYETNGVATQLMRVDQGGNVVAAGTITGSSDRNAKENFRPVKPQDVLNKVAALPITEWNYKHDKSAPHIGPMAQDFYAAFAVGTDDRHISMVDADGVALAAIQGLNQKLERKLEQKEREIADLKLRLQKLESYFDGQK